MLALFAVKSISVFILILRLPDVLSADVISACMGAVQNHRKESTMSITERISHAAERKAFETILDSMLKKGQTQDVGDLAEQLIDMIQKIHKGTWSDKSYETLRMVAENPDGKWARYTQRLIRENDPYIL